MPPALAPFVLAVPARLDLERLQAATLRLPGRPSFPAIMPDGTMLAPLQSADVIARVQLEPRMRVSDVHAYTPAQCVLPHQVSLGPDGRVYVVCEGVHTATRQEPGTVMVIDANTPGLPVPGSPYPWTGAYFQGNAVTVTALPAAGAPIRLVGFGPVAEGDARSAGVLRSATLTVTGRPSTYQVRLTGPGAQALGACTGDSGGPVYASEGGRPVVSGIVSWTTGRGSARCGALTGTVPVAPHRRWIEEAVRGLGGS